jgi:hypothetical protein
MNKLVEIARTKLGCGYVWGAQGELLTPEQLEEFKFKFGEKHYNLNDGTKADKWLGKQVFDCSGLILWCLQQLRYLPSEVDYNADMFYKMLCTKISKSDLIPGDLVFIKDIYGDMEHIGIYQGDGKTIEAMGTKFGVIEGNADRFNAFGRLRYDLEVAMTYKEIIEKCAGSAPRWEKAIETAVAAAKSQGDLGDLEIFEFLPQLIEKIYNSKA